MVAERYIGREQNTWHMVTISDYIPRVQKEGEQGSIPWKYKGKKKCYLLDSKVTKQQTRIRQTRTRIRETKSTLGARQKTQQTSCGSRAKKDGICKKGVEAWPRQLLCAGQISSKRRMQEKMSIASYCRDSRNGIQCMKIREKIHNEILTDGTA